MGESYNYLGSPNQLATEGSPGVAEIATQGEANGGTDDARILTPLKHSTLRRTGSFKAYQAAASNSLTSAVLTQITFDTKAWDVSTWFDLSTSRFTPQLAGTYIIGGSVDLAANANATVSQIYAAVYLNGTTVGFLQAITGPGNTGIVITGSLPVVLNGTTDYVELRASQSSGAARTTVLGAAFTNFWGYRIHG